MDPLQLQKTMIANLMTNMMRRHLAGNYSVPQIKDLFYVPLPLSPEERDLKIELLKAEIILMEAKTKALERESFQ